MRRPATTAALFVSLLLFWLALSTRFDVLFVGMGVVSAGVVTWLTRELVAEAFGTRRPRGRVPYRIWRAAVYLIWLLGRIFVASAQVALLVMHPRVPVEPAVLRFRTTLTHPLARTILANSITLVPGTMTLRMADGEYVVHALAPAAAGDLLSGRMQSIIAALFLEEEQPPPEVIWEQGVPE